MKKIQKNEEKWVKNGKKMGKNGKKWQKIDYYIYKNIIIYNY
jgi:hypothetical protein